MNICFVCNEYPPAPHGGVGIFVATVAAALIAEGHHVQVIGIYRDITSAAPDKTGTIPVLRIPSCKVAGRMGFILDRFRLASTVHRLVKVEHFDIVEAPDGAGLTAFFRPACPLLVRLHNAAPYYAAKAGVSRGQLTRWAENRALRRADAISAVSNFIADQACSLYPGAGLDRQTIRVIYNGVDTQRFKSIPYDLRDRGRVLFAGTLKPIKGVESLLRAFNQMLPDNPGASLHIYGKDTDIGGKSYFRTLLESEWYSDHARSSTVYHGVMAQEKMPQEYGAASVCVFPSLAESFGLVAAEAMSCGRPVIYSNRTTGPELIDNDRTGFLCDPECPVEIARAIGSVLSNPTQAASIGQAAAASVRERFAIRTCTEKTLQFYRECIAAFKCGK